MRGIAFPSIALMVGMAGGIAVGLHLDRSDPGADRSTAPTVVRDIVDVQTMSVEDAESQRVRGFGAILTIEDTLRFPTDFLRIESQYVLAGRSDSAALQDLIFQADRIADHGDRSRTLTILVHRLTELDPRSALAIVRTTSFASSPDLEQTVWAVWTGMDLDAALEAAVQETGWQRQNFVAQTLYSAFGFVESDSTARIERELGIPPDRIARGRYIRSLAERSPDEAIAFVNAMDPDEVDDRLIASIAGAVGRRFGQRAGAYGDQLTSEKHRETYRESFDRVLAELDPDATIQRLMGGRRAQTDYRQYSSALNSLAARDLDRVIGYFERAETEWDKQMIGSAIVRELGRKDVHRAIEWAMANDRDEYGRLIAQALSDAARDDPQLALNEAESLENRSQRRQVTSSVLSTIARDNRPFALRYIGTIEDRQERHWAAMSVVMEWAREDPDAALDWTLSQDDIESEQIVAFIGSSIVRSDIDAAIRLLPKIGGQSAREWRHRITRALVVQQSVTDAQRFIAQFEGENDYNDLQALVIANVGQNDMDSAKQMVAQMPAGPARDKAYRQLISTGAASDPEAAVPWIDEIENSEIRRSAIDSLVRNWYTYDADGAQRWIGRIQDDDTRDDAIVTIAAFWTEPTPSRNLMIEGITDLSKRAEARSNQIEATARVDWRRAEIMLASSSLSSADKDKLRQVIDQYKSGVP